MFTGLKHNQIKSKSN